ncbi:MAG: hypothetical protein CML66_05125 [Rhodobacteraceae bacterium]|nr:hypothetical protein [Paracoccaceae bacterium]MAY45303.1 hypothetical protein [Paracoccaceae bacterium]
MNLDNLIQWDIKPRYRAIVRAVVDGIAKRQIAIGDRLPPQRDLAHQLNVAVATVGRAYAELEKAGYVVSHVGRGTYITERKPQNSRPPDQDSQPIDLFTYRVQVAEMGDAFAQILRGIAATSITEVLNQAPAAEGDLRHREALCHWLSTHGIDVEPGQIVITNGGQHATMAALSTLTHAGETIATESLTDPKMKAVAGYLERRLAGVACDADGMIPEALEEICRRRQIAAIYCTPRNQNPTNTVMPADRRMRIAEIADRYDLPIIESDIYGTLRQDPEPPIQALVPHRTHLVTSLGRIAGPGTKLGCLVSPLKDVARTQSGVGMSTGSATYLQGEIACRWIEEGLIPGMVRWQQADTLRRVSMLAAYPILGQAVTRPSSPHVWLPLPEPWRADEFVDAALAHGILIAPTHNFAVGRDEVPHAVRLVIGSPPTHEDLGTALDRLERLAASPPRPHGRTA